MTLQLSRTTKIAIAAGVVVLGGIAYFFMGTSDDAAVMVAPGPASSAEAIFIDLATQLDPVAFDATILSDPRFLGLVDIHTNVVPEAVGRTDPFAPLPGTVTTQ